MFREQTCSVAANTNVAFGRADQFLYKILSGSFVCNSTTFGGKTAGGVNECSGSGLPGTVAFADANAYSVPDSVSDPDPSPSPPPDLGYYPGCAMPTNTRNRAAHGDARRCGGQGVRWPEQGLQPDRRQSEGQPPVFDVKDGGTVKNVIIGTLAADGIHCMGNCTLDHVWWQDIGEDAATALGPAGTVMTINCGAAYKG